MAKKVLLKVATPQTGDPVKGQSVDSPPTRIKGEFDNTADLRDAINNLVGYGYMNLDLQDAKGNYATLKRVLGEPDAQKMLTKIFIHNQRKDLLQSPAMERLQAFYDIGSNDKDLGSVIGKVKAFGHGVQGDIYHSANILNRTLAGNTALAGDVRANTTQVMTQLPKSVGLFDPVLNSAKIKGQEVAVPDVLAPVAGAQKKVLLRVKK